MKVEFILTIPPKKYMKSTYKIIWTDESLDGLKSIIEYLEERWTKREIKKFAKLVEKQISLIQNNPKLFPLSSRSNQVRRSVLSKQTTIYYKIVDNNVYIVSLFDNRRNPNSLIIK